MSKIEPKEKENFIEDNFEEKIKEMVEDIPEEERRARFEKMRAFLNGESEDWK